jgi:hypothetical protein
MHALIRKLWLVCLAYIVTLTFRLKIYFMKVFPSWPNYRATFPKLTNKATRLSSQSIFKNIIVHLLDLLSKR